MSGTAESPDQAPGNQQQQEFDLIGATAGTILLTASISASSQKRFTLQADGGFSVYDASGNVTLTWDSTNVLLNVVGGTKSLATILTGTIGGNGNTDFWVQFGAMPTWTAVNMPGGGNWHTFADCTISSTPGIGSGSFDAIPQFTGAGLTFTDHASFEGRPTLNSAGGTMGAFYGLFFKPVVTAGTVTTIYGSYIWNWSGAGAVGTYYGLYVDNINSASTNWAVYTVGSAQSSFGGNVLPGTDNQVNLGSTSFRWQNAFFSGASTYICAATTTDAIVSKVSGDAQNRFVLNADGSMEFGSGSAAADLTLRRASANVFQQSNTTNPQSFRIYGTTDSDTSPSAYERFQIRMQAGTTVLEQTQAGGGTARALNLQTVGSANLIFGTANTDRWKIDSSGNFLAQIDNTYNIGASGATRPLNVFVGGYVSCGVQCLTKTASTYAVTAAEKNAEYDNSGAAGQVAFTLPASAVGLCYTFLVLTAQNIQILGNGSDTIRVGGSISTATTGHIDNATVGGVIRLSCHVAGTWIATYQQGTWTVT